MTSACVCIHDVCVSVHGVCECICGCVNVYVLIWCCLHVIRYLMSTISPKIPIIPSCFPTIAHTSHRIQGTFPMCVYS